MADTGKYVVLAGQVAHNHFRGDVVTAEQIGFDEHGNEKDKKNYGKKVSRVPRLLALNSIRPATAAEAKVERVTLDEPGKPLTHSLEAQRAQMEQRTAEALSRASQHEIAAASLRGQVNELQGRLEAAEKQAARVIELEAQLQRMHKRLARKAGESEPPAE